MQIALITGGSRGLGKNAALHLADKGVDIILTYRSQKAEADLVVKEIQKRGRKAVALPLDVGASKTFGDFAATVTRVLGEIWQTSQFHALVNNAGMGVHASFLETTEAQFDELMNVHLKGPFFLSQKLVPIIADGGRIINLSSGLSRFSYPGYAAYGAMKGGIDTLTRYMAKELGARRISVNVVAPGAIETDFGGGFVRDNADLNRMIAGETALGRVGVPDDIGGLIASLLTDKNLWINGQRIEATGGIHL